MADEKVSPQLFENFLFTRIFQTFRMAIQPSKLIIALLAVAIICAAGQLMDLIWQQISDPQYRVFAGLWNTTAEGFHCVVYSALLLDKSGVIISTTDTLSTIWAILSDNYVFGIIFIAIALAVCSIAGGAICRISALQFARGEKPGLIEALRFSTKRFTNLFFAPLTPLGIIVFIGAFIFVLGLLGNISWIGELLMGIFVPLTLLAGGLIALVIIGAVSGLNLMFPAVAYDDSDCFDAISRSFSYVYARPWRMGFYTVVAACYGIICYAFVRFFTFLLLWVSHRSLQLGILGDNSKLETIWSKPTFIELFGSSALEPGRWTESVAAFLVYVFLLITVGLTTAFVISFYFSANTVIYSLMRKRVDNTALEDVYTSAEETEPGVSESEPGETQTKPEKKTESKKQSNED